MQDQVIWATLGLGVCFAACGDGGELTCGEGTTEKNGACVADPHATGGSATGGSDPGGGEPGGGEPGGGEPGGGEPGGGEPGGGEPGGGRGGTMSIAGSGGAPPAGSGGSVAGGAGTGGSAPNSCDRLALFGRWIIFDSDRDGSRDIYLMSANGEHVYNMTQTPDIDETEPALSPGDGAELLYVENGDFIVKMVLATREILRVGTGQQPTWSPNGAEIAYQRAPSVYRASPTGANASIVIPGNELHAYANPVFTPDGQYLVVDRGDQINEAHRENGSSRYVVLNAMTVVVAPDISPDGTLLVFSADCGVQSLRIGFLATETNPCETWSLTSVPSTKPSWGPSNFIAYVEGAEPRDIAVISADTREGCTFDASGDDDNPSWAPARFTPPAWLD